MSYFPVRQITEGYAPRYEYTFNIVESVLDLAQVSRLVSVHRALVAHTFRTGQIAADFLSSSGADRDLQRIGAMSAGLHDIGYLTHPDQSVRDKMLTLRDRPGVLEDNDLEWLRDAHTTEGEVFLLALAAGQENPDLELDIGTAAFVNGRHHTDVPKEYTSLPKQEALHWGLTHLTIHCDRLDALQFDPDRPYIFKREGRVLTAGDKLTRVLGEDPRNPIVAGIEVDIVAAVSSALGINGQ